MSSRLDYIKSLYLNGIFGVPPLTIGKNTQISENTFNDDETRSGNKPNLYTKVSEDLIVDDSQDLTIDIDKVSYAPTRGEGKTFGNTSSAFRFKPSDNFDGDDFDKQRDSENKYSKQDDIQTKTLESKRGMRNGLDIINQSPIKEEDILVDGKTPLEEYDLIPLVIKIHIVKKMTLQM